MSESNEDTPASLGDRYAGREDRFRCIVPANFDKIASGVDGYDKG